MLTFRQSGKLYFGLFPAISGHRRMALHRRTMTKYALKFFENVLCEQLMTQSQKIIKNKMFWRKVKYNVFKLTKHSLCPKQANL